MSRVLLLFLLSSTSALAALPGVGAELAEDAGVPERAPGLGSPVFEVGLTMLTSSTAELSGGPTFRCVLTQGSFLASGSLDWAIGGGAGRALILMGAGFTRVMRPRVRLFGLAMGGIDATNGPPILVLPVMALRVGGDWLAAWLFLKSVGASMTMAYDVPYAWSGPGAPSRGFTFWVSLSAAFEVLR